MKPTPRGKVAAWLLFVALVLVPEVLPAETVKLSNGITLFYKTAGSGRVPVVLVHGYAMSWEIWERVMGNLPPQFSAYAVDLRGFGDSDKPDDGYAFEQMADDLIGFVNALGIPKAVFVGHSMGGSILQHLAVNHPEKVLGLVLSNSLACNAPPRGLSESIRRRIEGYGTSADNEKLFRSGFPTSFDAQNVTPEEIDRFVKTALKAGNTALRQTLENLFTAPAIPGDHFAAVKAPALILVGTHDRLATFDNAVALSDAFAGSKVRVLTRCGHSPMWERSGEFTRELSEFLLEVSGPPGASVR